TGPAVRPRDPGTEHADPQYRDQRREHERPRGSGPDHRREPISPIATLRRMAAPGEPRSDGRASETRRPVALDAYGADGGPELVLDGARIAAADGIPVRLFGPASLDPPPGVELDPTTEWIGNEAEPVPAVRAKPDASVVRGAAAVADGSCGALVSAGSTGATMTAALFTMKRAQGVHRPALAVQFPVPGADGPPLVFLDSGANTDVRPQHLIQFAFLGSAFSAAVLGVESPRVA